MPQTTLPAVPRRRGRPPKPRPLLTEVRPRGKPGARPGVPHAPRESKTPTTAAGRELRLLRRLMNLTQVALAAQLGLRADTLSRYERGVHHTPEPTLRLARRLAGGLARTAARPEGETR